MTIPEFNTLLDLMAYRARETGHQVAFTFQGQSHTYGRIWRRINRFAVFLRSLSLERNEPVLIALPNGPEFFPAFYGVQRAGGIAVPIFPGFSPARILAMVQLCGARVVVLPSDVPAHQLAPFSRQAGQHGLILVDVADSRDCEEQGEFPGIEPDDLSFLQYTSGSTGNPKGVQISHRNLLTNVNQMIAGMEISDADIFVSWLPLYHDMGLILKSMVPFYLAAELHLLPANLNRVDRWLEAIQRHRATFTAAPDFAYRLALRRVADPAAHDLSSLRVALNAAEPVRSSTIHDFEAAFGLKDVMVAGYGLAEATVGVSMWPPGRPPRIDARGHVSVGPPFPDIALSILQDGRPVAAGQVGEIAICSSANSRGYFNNPQATQQAFIEDSTLLSGDLGYLDEDGYLYIVGRKKNLIIQTGHNLYPAEIEEVVNSVAGVRYSAAVGIDRGRIEGEQATIFAEVTGDETTPADQWRELVIEIVSRFHDRFGFRPGRVFLLKPKSIPLTHNGKLRHSALKEQFLQRKLRQNGQILFPEDVS